MIWLVLGSLVPSMVIAWAAAFWVRRYGPRFGLVDRPGHRKVHQTPTPTSGGLAIWLGIVVPFAIGQGLLAVVLVGGHGGSSETANGGQARPLNVESPIPLPAIAAPISPAWRPSRASCGKCWPAGPCS